MRGPIGNTMLLGSNSTEKSQGNRNNGWKSFGAITDGTSNTIIFAERCTGTDSSRMIFTTYANNRGDLLLAEAASNCMATRGANQMYATGIGVDGTAAPIPRTRQSAPSCHRIHLPAVKPETWGATWEALRVITPGESMSSWPMVPSRSFRIRSARKTENHIRHSAKIR